MAPMSPHQVVLFFLSIAVVLGAARLFGELAKRLHQPAVLGELLAGILLGPTLLGKIAPQWTAAIFPQEGALAVALDGLRTVAIALFMLVAGLDVDLSTMRRQGKAASVVSLTGMLFPFVTGFAAAWFYPSILGKEPRDDHFLFAAFIATAMSISALPVIARTLMDLNLYRSDMGMVVIAAAIFNDLVGWLVFALLLGSMGGGAGHDATTTLWMTLAFVLAALTLGRWLIHKALPWIHAHTSWPGGFLGFAFVLALLGAALAAWIGIHPIFGSFLVGVALGDSSHVREHTKKVMGQFTSYFFAPLFFASIGLGVDFIGFFDVQIFTAVCVIAMFGKVLGCGLGARWAGIARREAWSIGVCLNARGAMEIIVGLLALQSGLIGRKLFVALVLMALLTSVMTGPIVSRLLRKQRPRRLVDYLSQRGFVNPLRAADRFEAIQQLCQAVSTAGKLDGRAVEAAVWKRESMMSTGMGKGVAVPHARLDSLSEPLVAIGLSRAGVDFDAPDGEPAQIICLILTPIEDDGAQLALLADVARTLGTEQVRHQAVQTNSYTDFLAVLNTQAA